MTPPERHRVRRAVACGTLAWMCCLATGLGASGPCDPNEPPCLAERFTVEAGWTDPRSGESGRGRALSITADTGALWFFDPDNLELVVKVLDARSVNGRYWVFASGLTDLPVELEVEDSVTGLSRVYRNPPFTPPGVQDTAASVPSLWRLASRVVFEGGLPAGFIPTGPGEDDRPPARLLEVAAGEPRAGLDLWQVLIDNAGRHPSQFPPEILEALERVVEERRRVFLLDTPPD